MSTYHAYMWSVSDWRTDEMHTVLNNRERGIYRELIDECWVAGSITSDVDVLARMVGETLPDFLQAWHKMRPKFAPIDKGKRLISVRLEQDRRRFMLKGNLASKKAKKAAEIRWNKYRAERELHATSNAQAYAQAMLGDAQTHTHKEDNSSLLHSPNTCKSVVPEITLPACVENARPRDLASDFFVSTSLEVTGVPYVPEAADFVMLAKLRTAFHCPARSMPPDWEGACKNYFASPLSQYSITDLANPKRYAVFKNSPLDGFNKQLAKRNRSHGFQETYADRVARENRATAALFNRELPDANGNGSGPEGDERAHRPLLPRPE